MLIAVAGAWMASRAMLWENPLATDTPAGFNAARMAAGSKEQAAPLPPPGHAGAQPSASQPEMAQPALNKRPPRVASATQRGAASLWAGNSINPAPGMSPPVERRPDAPETVPRTTAPPFFPPLESRPEQSADRWSLDAWVFWREGSRAAPIAQTRVPVYGASQIGANLQYRVAPNSRQDPRAFVRAYHALVPNGETELGAGISARPVAAVPVRVVAELRGVEDQFGTDLRPAAYAFTEIPTVGLPADFTLEAYGGAGYVAGRAQTAFADGQIVALREVTQLGDALPGEARISLGGGAWGGAQKGAHRLDVGPSLRADFAIAETPARLSVDYRERVAGGAAPQSGVAVTLSTRF